MNSLKEHFAYFYLNCFQNSDTENFMLIEMLDANEDGEVDSFEWTTMLRQVQLSILIYLLDFLILTVTDRDSILPHCVNVIEYLEE